MSPNRSIPKSTTVTVSLTSTSGRVGQVHQVIDSLLKQSVAATRIVLWLSSDAHLLDEGVCEQDLDPQLKARRGERFDIRWTPNIGPYRKLIPALREFGGMIVTADDDTLYPPSWLEGLLLMHEQSPHSICCYRAHRMLIDERGDFASYWRWPRCNRDEPGLDCFPTGKDGVLYPANCMHEDVHDIEKLLSLAPTNDDIWFKVMSLRRKTLARCMPNHDTFPVTSVINHLDGLYTRYNLLDNDTALKRVVADYELEPRVLLDF